MHNHHKTALNGIESLENRRVLAAALPDVFPWADAGRGYLYDYFVEGNLLRFSTAIANQGTGALELRGGDPLPNGNQEVIQRIFNEDGSIFEDRVAGEFTYHPSHGHIHFDGYAIYNLREQDHEGNPGEIVATGGKVSFCVIDITPYDPEAGPHHYSQCDSTVQGLSAGWADVYHRFLPDQWINISGLSDGDYFLEVITDPYDQLVESDETNNTTIIPITIAGGPASQGDSYEPNNNFLDAHDLGPVSNLHSAGMSIHLKTDVDYYRFTAIEDGTITAEIQFANELGNLELEVYDEDYTLLGSSYTTNDLESVQWLGTQGDSYFVRVDNVLNETNGYELLIDGPGDFGSLVLGSNDPSLPAAIPDGVGSGTPGTPLISTVYGPDVVLTDLNLILDDLDHGYLGDLHVELSSPSGTTATLIRSRFETPAGALGSQNDFTRTILDDEAPTSLAEGSAPYTGRFNVNHPSVVQDPLSAFVGENASGIWTLMIQDWFNSDQGALNAWSIEFTGNLGDRLETNDFFPQATDLGTMGSAAEAGLSIHTGSDRDFFRFVPESDSAVEISVDFAHGEGNLDVALYNDQLVQVALASSTDDNELLRYPVEGDALYYIEVYSAGDDVAAYDLEVSTGPLGDFNDDDLVDAIDIDALRQGILDNATPWAFDLTGDGLLSQADMDVMVLDVVGTLYGDANLDRIVDGQDFIAWNDHKFQSGGWSEGNFNLDQVVDGQDFIEWNNNKFTAAPLVFNPKLESPWRLRSTKLLKEPWE